MQTPSFSFQPFYSSSELVPGAFEDGLQPSPERQFSVLVISDDFHTRQHLVALLRALHYKPLRARSVPEAVAGLEQNPDLLIVDQRLRGSDGISWIKWLREQDPNKRSSRYRNQPIIYCCNTACTKPNFDILRNLLRVALIVQKPCSPSLLARQIEHLVNPQNVLQFSPSPGGEVMQETLSQAQQEELETRLALEALGQSYLAEMPETLYELRNQITAAALERDDASLLRAAVTTAHNVKGTAGTFGFRELSEMAGRIESMLRQYKPDAGAASHEPIAGSLILVAEIEMWLEDNQDNQDKRAPKSDPVKSVPALCDSALRVKGKVAEIVIDIGVGAPGADVSELAPVFTQELTPELTPEPVPASVPVLSIQQTAAPGLMLAPQAGFVAPVLQNMCPKPMPLSNAYLHPILYPDLHREIHWVTDIRQRALIIAAKGTADEALDRALARHGNWHIERIAGGIKALGHIDECAPDLLILDCLSDGDDLNGLDICRMIRCHPKWAALHVIIMTDDISFEGRQAIFQSGASDFIVKPIIEDELCASLRSLRTRALS